MRESSLTPIPKPQSARRQQAANRMQAAIVGGALAKTKANEATAKTHYSISHARWLYRRVYGESLGQAAKRVRLDRAAYELSKGRFSIRAISRRAGYASQEAFTRAFARRFGITPRGFARGKAPASPKRKAIDIGIAFAVACTTNPIGRHGQVKT